MSPSLQCGERMSRVETQDAYIDCAGDVWNCSAFRACDKTPDGATDLILLYRRGIIAISAKGLGKRSTSPFDFCLQSKRLVAALGSRDSSSFEYSVFTGPILPCMTPSSIFMQGRSKLTAVYLSASSSPGRSPVPWSFLMSLSELLAEHLERASSHKLP